MSEPQAPGYEITRELLEELLQKKPVILTPEETEALKKVAKAYMDRQERWASFRANWPIIAFVVSTLTTVLTALVTYITTHLPVSPR